MKYGSLPKVEPIRNGVGSLLCEAVFSKDDWLIMIKRKDCYTTICLHPGGSIDVSDSTDGDANAV